MPDQSGMPGASGAGAPGSPPPSNPPANPPANPASSFPSNPVPPVPPNPVGSPAPSPWAPPGAQPGPGPQPGQPPEGYPQAGQPPPGYPQPGYPQPGYPQPGQPPHTGWRPAPGPGEGGDGWVPPPAPGAPQVPRCYRHPDRETYVSCQRCGRPICPDCMRPAAVGFHCPEEGRGEGSGGRVRQPRGSLGTRPLRQRPGLVTQILIGLCVLAYFLQDAPGLGGQEVNPFTADFALWGPAIAINDEYYRLVTAAFLHGSLIHILFNMYALYLLGHQLEAVLGRARYIGLFLACAVGGNTLSYWVNGLEVFSVGASTAIFGFFAAYYVLARRMRMDTTQILIVVAINLAITFTVSNIDRWGHIGGLVVGAVVGLLYAYVPPRKAAYQAVGVVAIIVGLFMAAMIKTNMLDLPVFLGGFTT